MLLDCRRVLHSLVTKQQEKVISNHCHQILWAHQFLSLFISSTF